MAEDHTECVAAMLRKDSKAAQRAYDGVARWKKQHEKREAERAKRAAEDKRVAERLERMSDAEFAALGAPASVQKLRPTPGCRAPGQRSSLVRFSGVVENFRR